MKIFFSRPLLVLGSAFLVAVPATVLLPSCGGGGSSSSLPAVRLFSAPVQLSANQTAKLNVRLRGITVEGELIVNEPTGPNPGPTPGALPFNLPADTYLLTGTFTAPRGFTLTGEFPAPVGTFTVTGQIPTSSENGTFSITAGGSTVSGTFPKI